MNVHAIAENYSRMHGNIAPPVESARRKFSEWLREHEHPYGDLPDVPTYREYRGLSSMYAVSGDGEGGISAWWFLKGNEVFGVPNLPESKKSGAVGWKVPLAELDRMPVVLLKKSVVHN